MEEQLEAIIGAILTPEAKDRLARLSLVKQEKVQQLKLQLVQKAQSGVLRQRVTEEQLIQMLEQVARHLAVTDGDRGGV